MDDNLKPLRETEQKTTASEPKESFRDILRQLPKILWHFFLDSSNLLRPSTAPAHWKRYYHVIFLCLFGLSFAVDLFQGEREPWVWHGLLGVVMSIWGRNLFADDKRDRFQFMCQMYVFVVWLIHKGNPLHYWSAFCT